ncbi:MAG: hypothetical protein QOE90_1240 [Thermoplasmata archaeon]|jgi:hypothetical protein|nr:hypothetical protein [Thermoplasmata archaeon]
MPKPEPEPQPRPSRTRRALIWLLKAPFRLLWLLVKWLGKLLWWAFSAGFKAGRSAPREAPEEDAPRKG